MAISYDATAGFTANVSVTTTTSDRFETDCQSYVEGNFEPATDHRAGP
jgi:hypothetical protein